MPSRLPDLGDVRALVRRVVASGQAWVAPTLFEGRDVVRICATNGETSLADVEGAGRRPKSTALNALCQGAFDQVLDRLYESGNSQA